MRVFWFKIRRSVWTLLKGCLKSRLEVYSGSFLRHLQKSSCFCIHKAETSNREWPSFVSFQLHLWSKMLLRVISSHVNTNEHPFTMPFVHLAEKLQRGCAVPFGSVTQTSDDLLEQHISCLQFTHFQRFRIRYSLRKIFLGRFSADESIAYNGLLQSEPNRMRTTHWNQPFVEVLICTEGKCLNARHVAVKKKKKLGNNEAPPGWSAKTLLITPPLSSSNVPLRFNDLNWSFKKQKQQKDLKEHIWIREQWDWRVIGFVSSIRTWMSA